jgi:hypothetical protein
MSAAREGCADMADRVAVVATVEASLGAAPTCDDDAGNDEEEEKEDDTAGNDDATAEVGLDSVKLTGVGLAKYAFPLPEG